ncbi:MAG: hypothetical protein H7X70_03405 [Candidatus Kapabacteria bacterium]|nr:hypothetical protein [Candidatus Kapabacteria bacterium]
MSKFIAASISVAVFMGFLAGCSESTNPKTPLVVPASYNAVGYSANTSAEYVIRTQMTALATLMKTGRVQGATVSLAELMAAYEPLAAITGEYYRLYVPGYLTELSTASGGSYDWQSTPSVTSSGGVYSGYLFQENGLEMEQLVDKGLFAAGLYNRASILMDGDVSAAAIDKIVALFGAHASFPNTDKAASNADKFAASYAARRDQNDGNGLYTKFKVAAITAQAAAVAGSEYKTELNASLATMRQTWERALMATVINYTYAVVDGLSATTVTDASRAGAMHAYGECVGFLHGWKAVRQSSRIITDTQLGTLLGLLQAPADGPWTSYLIWQNPVSHLIHVSDARALIKSIYGFTDVEMESFKTNWVTAQNRQ